MMNRLYKYWIYYIKNDNDTPPELYAYTDDKSLAKEFEISRDMNRFIKVKKELSKEEVTTSFWETLERKAHLYPGHAVQHISATKATEKIANYLNVKRGDPLLRMTQLSYLQDGTPFEYVHTQYVGSRFEFVLEK